jgi:hypothetical protein
MKQRRHRLSSIFAVLLFAGLPPGARLAADSPPAPPRSVRAPLACKPVDGLAPLLQPGSILLLGELHGTAESPAFVGNAVCLALAAGRPVTVALEIWREEEARIDAFLASSGAAADRAALFDSSFWRDRYQDGRRSEAMAGLLDDLRRWRHDGWPVRVALLDRQVNGSGQERDRAMADRLQSISAAALPGLVITLTGNLHNRLSRGVPWDKSYENMGFLFVQKGTGVRATSLNVRWTGGTAWLCQGLNAGEDSCKAWPVKAGPGDGIQKVVFHPELDADGFNGVYEVGKLTASLPAAPLPPMSPMSPVPPK